MLAAAAITAGWGGLATHTAGGAVTDTRAVLSSLAGHTAGVRSGTVGYGLLAGAAPGPGRC